MVEKLRRLLGRVDVRTLILLVCTLTLAAVLLALAKVNKPPTEDLGLPIISSWDELVEMYLAARERDYPLVLPIWFFEGAAGKALDEDYLAALQKQPDWYWTFGDGTFYFDEKSEFGKNVMHDTRVVIYEDIVNKEVLVLSRVKEESEDFQEEVVYQAPEWPAVEEDYDTYLWRQISKRRIVWRVTLKSASKAAEEAEAIIAAAEASAVFLEPGLDGGGIMTMGARGGSNDLWLSIERLPDAWSNGVEVTIHLPVGYTNAVEIYTFDANENAHFAGVASSPWVLAVGSSETAGTNLIVWTDTSVTGTPARFYAAGGGDADEDGLSDGAEKYQRRTNPNDADTDSDGMPDGWEATYGLDPLVDSDAETDSDEDGLSNLGEFQAGTNPEHWDSDGDGISDGWEVQHVLNPLSGCSPSLAGWWKFDDGTGTDVVNSASAAYNGHLVNMAPANWTTGRLGSALSFDGADDYVSIPQSPAMVTGSEFTISAWVWHDGSAGDEYRSVITDMGYCNDSFTGFWLNYDTCAAGVAGLFGTCDGYSYAWSTQNITSRWVHLALSYDGSEGRLYADGVKVASQSGSFAPAERPEIRIGHADDQIFTYHWKGLLDDVRVYTVGLSSNAVFSMYDALQDLDEDALSNLEEFQAGTNPRNADTDGDGFSDYEEIHLAGTNPTDAADGIAMIESARARISAHWSLIFPEPLVFTNTPGSQADLQDMVNALAAMSEVFTEVGFE